MHLIIIVIVAWKTCIILPIDDKVDIHFQSVILKKLLRDILRTVKIPFYNAFT